MNLQFVEHYITKNATIFMQPRPLFVSNHINYQQKHLHTGLGDHADLN